MSDDALQYRNRLLRALKKIEEQISNPQPYQPELRLRNAGEPVNSYDGLSSQDALCLASSMEILLNSTSTIHHLAHDGWVETEEPLLIERISVNRAMHKVEGGYLKEEFAADADGNRERFSAIKRRYLPTAHQPYEDFPYKIRYYAHPSCVGMAIQTTSMNSLDIAVFMEKRFVEASLGVFQCDLIKSWFTTPTRSQSTRYVVGYGGKEIDAELREHSRDGIERDYSVRIGKSAPVGLLDMNDQIYPVFAEMRHTYRSV